MTEQQKQNRKIIENLVRSYFDLKENSLEVFSSKLWNPEIPKEYSKMLPDGELKVRFKIPTEYLKVMDEGWKRFYQVFNPFIENNNVSYSNFHNNRITINKNEMRLSKALEKYYLSSKEKIRTLETSLDILGIPIFTNNSYLEREIIPAFSYKGEPKRKEDFSFQVINGETYSIDVLSYKERIQNTLDSIGVMSLPKKNSLELVLSLNFPDWFLCSTGESWGSCISLDSEYDGTYWTGLPGTIVDKNRAILYITDGSVKEYEGIRTERMLFRTFVLLNSEGNPSIVRWFPNEVLKKRDVISITGINFKEVLDDFTPKYTFSPLYHNNSRTSFIYQDNAVLDWYSTMSNILTYYGGQSGFVSFNKDTRESFFNSPNYRYTRGLTGLIEAGESIAYFDKSYISCDSCGEEIPEEESVRVFDSFYCEGCFEENFFFCEDCGATEHVHEMSPVDFICNVCFEENYGECNRCGDLIQAIDLVEYNSEFICPNCYREAINEERNAV